MLNENIEDAKKRYKTIYGKEIVEDHLYFLDRIKSFNGKLYFYDDGAKLVIDDFYTIDYNFDEKENVFISAFINDKLVIIDIKINNIAEEFEKFK